MDKWQGQSKANSLGYRIFIFFLKAGGIGAAYALARFVVLYYLFFSRSSNIALRQYFRVYRSYFNSLPRFPLYRTYFRFAQVLIDKIAVLGTRKSPFRVKMDGVNHLTDMANDGKGAFLIGAHMGNWEIAGHMLEEVTYTINVVMLDAEHESIKKTLSDVNEKRSFKVIPIKNDLSHLFHISKAADDKEFICMHGDRFLPGSRTIKARFLGKEAEFPLGPFLMAEKLKLPVSFVHGFKLPGKEYQLYASEPLRGEYSAEEIFDLYLANLEEKVRLYPTQWFNFYTFWTDEHVA